jgi:hypothetical protein
MACSISRAAVTITASVSGVQKGGAITFTATTDESDPVDDVTFSYEGTTDTDVDTTSPYQVTTTMDWTTLEDLTVTATFAYNSIADQSDTVDVDVIDITFIGPSSPVRGSTASFWAITSPSGIGVSSWSWSYDYDAARYQSNTVTWTDTANSDHVSNWLGTIAEPGTVEVSATISGVSCTKNASISITPRSGGAWVTPVACVEDNEPNWGSLIDVSGENTYGQIRDLEGNAPENILVPQTSADDWSDAVTIREITLGPNKGLFYVYNTTLEVDQETVINQHIKSGAPNPPGASENTFEHNDASGGCQEGEMGDFVQAIKNHEYRGTPSTASSLEGHFGRLEYWFDNNPDPSVSIESVTDTTENDVVTAVNTTLDFIEGDIQFFMGHQGFGDWPETGPNWGGAGSLGSGQHSVFDDYGFSWTACDYGPANF